MLCRKLPELLRRLEAQTKGRGCEGFSLYLRGELMPVLVTLQGEPILCSDSMHTLLEQIVDRLPVNHGHIHKVQDRHEYQNRFLQRPIEGTSWEFLLPRIEHCAN